MRAFSAAKSATCGGTWIAGSSRTSSGPASALAPRARMRAGRRTNALSSVGSGPTASTTASMWSSDPREARTAMSRGRADRARGRGSPGAPRPAPKWPAVTGDAVEADDARRRRRPHSLEVEPHTVSWSASSDSGTSSVRRSSFSFTSDQITLPSLSIRNVPRNGPRSPR